MSSPGNASDSDDLDGDDFSPVWESVAAVDGTRLWKLSPTFNDSHGDSEFFTHQELAWLRRDDQYIKLTRANPNNTFFYDSQAPREPLFDMYISQTCLNQLANKTYPTTEESIPYRRSTDGTMGKLIPRDREPSRRPPKADPNQEDATPFFWQIPWDTIYKKGITASSPSIPPRFVNPDIPLVLEFRNQLLQAGINLQAFESLVNSVKGLTKQTNVTVQSSAPDQSVFICVCN